MHIGNIAAAVSAVAVLITGVGATTAAASAAASAPASSHRIVAIEATGRAGYGDVTYKPGRFNIVRGGPVLFAKHLRWSDWNSRVADGRGKLIAEDSTRWSGTATLHFHKTATKYGERYFTKLHIIGGRGVAHFWYWSWSAGNWLGY